MGKNRVAVIDEKEHSLQRISRIKKEINCCSSPDWDTVIVFPDDELVLRNARGAVPIVSLTPSNLVVMRCESCNAIFAFPKIYFNSK